jgi:N6-L-threonylcarbamoyladenine synthase
LWKQQVEDAFKLGHRLSADGLIFPKSILKPTAPQLVRDASKTLAKAFSKVGFAGFTAHSLRHTHASLLLSDGVPIVAVSQRLGHANPTITLNTYSHLVKRAEDQAAAVAGSLLVGLTAAKALCVAWNLPLLAVNHLQAHIYACRLASGRDVFPCIGLIVSGGHSNIYRCDGPTDFTPLGGTIDDAAGEAFDKVASLLGLPYPGGPSIERAARHGDPSKHRFPRPLLDDRERLDFSFSGLKTAVRYLVVGPGKLGAGSREQGDAEPGGPVAPRSSLLAPGSIADIAASFQEAVVDCLVDKAELALAKTGYRTLCVGGGVAANSRFRQRLEASARERGHELHVPPLALCTDNAVMGAIAVERFRAGLFEDLTLEIHPGPERAAQRAG